jgi:putative NADH-flavin reductase
LRPQGPGDATQADVIEPAVAGTDAVICTIGTSFTRKPVDVYSASSRLVVAAMRRHGRQRLLVVTSSGVNPAHGRAGSRTSCRTP